MPCPIKNKTFPVVFVLACMVLLGLRLDLWVFMAVGIFASKYIGLDTLYDVKLEKARKWEETCMKYTHFYGHYKECPKEDLEEKAKEEEAMKEVMNHQKTPEKLD